MKPMAKENCLSILFIGNSHTYFNDMPAMVQRRAAENGFDCRITMLAHPGWFLAEHAEWPEARFNILYGKYDYVVLQEHAHPFGPEEKFRDAARTLIDLIRKAGSIPVIYGSWARKSEPEMQERMNQAYRAVVQETNALYAPVGEYWWQYKEARPELELYADDGEHASAAGSDFAAKCIWETISAQRDGSFVSER